MSLAKELVNTEDSLPLQLLIESADVDSPGKYICRTQFYSIG
jgi:hypothetical protein